MANLNYVKNNMLSVIINETHVYYEKAHSDFCVTLQVVVNFETIIRQQGIESLFLRLAVLGQIQRDS